MRLGTYVAAAIRVLNKNGIYAGKTNVQKVVYFSLHAKHRRTYYQPYHYGPYCGEVQQAMNALLSKGVLIYDGTNFSVIDNWIMPDGKDPVVGRMEIATRFLYREHITKTDEIAFLAKIHLLSRTQREDAQHDLTSHIQTQAKFLGWRELALAKRNDISRYLHMSQALEQELDSIGMA